MSVKQLDRHDEYYIKGGDLYIVVGTTLFRVHSYFFHRESQRFRDIMSTPVPGQTLRQGEADNSAIIIKDISADQFAKFLWIFYNPLYTVYTATLAEWISILKLAHEYQFPEVKRLAIRELEEFDIQIAQRILLYQTHTVDPAYLVPLYVKLCMREEGPTDEETTVMGMKTSLIIFRARERLRFRPLSGAKNVASPATNENDITRTIYSLLGFDYNGQTSLVPRRRETGAVPTRTRVDLRRSRTESREVSSLSVLNDHVESIAVAPEGEKHLGGNVRRRTLSLRQKLTDTWRSIKGRS